MSSQSLQTRFGVLTYISRSGSTLFSRLLNEQAGVCVTLEANLPAQLFGIHRYKVPVFEGTADLERFIDVAFERTRLASWQLDRTTILAHAERSGFPLRGTDLLRLLLTLYRDRHKPGAGVVLYKGSPVQPWDLERMLASYPDFKAVHILRDPRGVYNSQNRSVDPYRKRRFANHPVKTAIRWKRAARGAARLADDRIHCLRYEALVDDPVSIVRETLHFLDLEPSKAGVPYDMASRLPAAERAIHTLVDHQPDPARSEAWRKALDASDVAWLEGYLGKEMRAVGYEPLSRPGPLRAATTRTRAALVRAGALGYRLARSSAGLLRLDPHYLGKLRSLFGGE